MTKPLRIRRERTKGWRKPPNTVICMRPGPFGNPCRCDEQGIPRMPDGIEISLNGLRYIAGPTRDPSPTTRAFLVAGFRWWINRPEQQALRARIRRELRGKNLSCSCPLYEPCHVDVILELANR